MQCLLCTVITGYVNDSSMYPSGKKLFKCSSRLSIVYPGNADSNILNEHIGLNEFVPPMMVQSDLGKQALA